MIIRCVFGSTNGLNNAWLKMSIFTEKSSFLTKLIFISVAMWTSRIVVFGDQRIRTLSWKSQCIHNEWLFGVVFGPAASLSHFSSKMSKELPSLSMASATARILTSQIWRGGHRRHLVSTGRRTLPHSQRYNRLRTIFENRIISRNANVN